MMFFGWILIAALIYYLVSNNNVNLPKASSRTPREVLDQRFVNGEIDEETYNRMKKALEDR